MQRILILVALVLMFCLGAAFSFHNPASVEVNYLVGESELPLGALIMGVTALAVSVTSLIIWLLSLPAQAERLRLKRRLERAEKELDKLRQLPLKDG